MNSFAGIFQQGVARSGLGVYLKHKATGNPVTAGTARGYITVDDGAQSPIGTAPVHKDRGQWIFPLTGAELGGLVTAGLIEHDDADPVHFTISTQAADMGAIAGDSGAATNLAAGANGLVPFTVGPSPGATSIPTSLTTAPYTTTDHFEGAIVVINGERRKIFGSSGNPVVLTTETFNSIPAQNDAGVIS